VRDRQEQLWFGQAWAATEKPYPSRDVLVIHLRAALERLNAVDLALGNRAAFDGFPTREAKIAHAIATAKLASEGSPALPKGQT
jgi:hypothetical protein